MLRKFHGKNKVVMTENLSIYIKRRLVQLSQIAERHGRARLSKGMVDKRHTRSDCKHSLYGTKKPLSNQNNIASCRMQKVGEKIS